MNLLLAIYLDRIQYKDSILCGFCCITFTEYMLARKISLDYTNLTSFKINMSSIEFNLNKIGETKNYLLEEIKHNNLMSEKYNKTCEYLNYVELLLILASTTTSCISISAIASLICDPVGIMSSAVGTKLVQSLQELNSKNKLQRERRSMVK